MNSSEFAASYKKKKKQEGRRGETILTQRGEEEYFTRGGSMSVLHVPLEVSRLLIFSLFLFVQDTVHWSAFTSLYIEKTKNAAHRRCCLNDMVQFEMCIFKEKISGQS